MDELEEEEFINKKFARDDEDPIPWSVEELSKYPSKSKTGFYPMNQFCVFQNYTKANETLHFPEFLYMSKNHYQLQWTLNRTHRRLKNVIIVFEYEPSVKEKVPPNASNSIMSSMLNSGQFSQVQEQLLQRCFNLFDSDEDGKLTHEDIDRVIQVMGVEEQSAQTLHAKYVELIESKGGFTLGVYREMVKDIASQFKKQEGKFYVMLSLVEAEHLRSFMHGKRGRTLLNSEENNPLVTSPTNGAMWVMSDYDVAMLDATLHYTKASFAPHTAMVSSYRYVNSDTHYSPAHISTLLRVLEIDPCELREKWWHDIRACRRRRQIALDGTVPIVTVFNTRSEFEYMEYKAIVSRVQTGLSDKGMLVFDAFRAFNSSHTGLLTCSELYGGMEYLGISFTPQQIYDLVKKVAVQTEVGVDIAWVCMVMYDVFDGWINNFFVYVNLPPPLLYLPSQFAGPDQLRGFQARLPVGGRRAGEPHGRHGRREQLRGGAPQGHPRARGAEQAHGPRGERRHHRGHTHELQSQGT